MTRSIMKMLRKGFFPIQSLEILGLERALAHHARPRKVFEGDSGAKLRTVQQVGKRYGDYRTFH
ncbi:hypothetical protein [Pedobacter frigidisoli]|uniref:hypothetical protein n=1 Tax=Pedobacter frigidisoli TaxID=2530455 RepID=UPI00292E9F35|nr:hypothetical protein [Pedobacter frigidisoli]